MFGRAFEILPRSLRETWEAPFSFQSPYPTWHLHICYLDTGEVKQVTCLLLFFLGFLVSMVPIPYYLRPSLYPGDHRRDNKCTTVSGSKHELRWASFSDRETSLSLSSLEAHLLLCTGHKPSIRLILCVKRPQANHPSLSKAN